MNGLRTMGRLCDPQDPEDRGNRGSSRETSETACPSFPARVSAEATDYRVPKIPL